MTSACIAFSKAVSGVEGSSAAGLMAFLKAMSGVRGSTVTYALIPFSRRGRLSMAPEKRHAHVRLCSSPTDESVAASWLAALIASPHGDNDEGSHVGSRGLPVHVRLCSCSSLSEKAAAASRLAALNASPHDGLDEDRLGSLG